MSDCTIISDAKIDQQVQMVTVWSLPCSPSTFYLVVSSTDELCLYQLFDQAENWRFSYSIFALYLLTEVLL